MAAVRLKVVVAPTKSAKRPT
ncbi:hypothetical protein MPLSOD_40229 [Mesorhizobium sp. SOD10]|nr:hypothetical protein MPLSOD_40229 [Mesorhizobium sp. SOD10]